MIRIRNLPRGGLALWGGMVLLLAAQCGFSIAYRPLRAAIDNMPPPPQERALKAMAFGDNEFLFRFLGRWLQDVGDGGGRIKPLREFDYDRVVGWLRALDTLDDGRSEYIHVLAGKYFGQITAAVDTDHTKLHKILSYLRDVGLSNPKMEWPWLIWVADKIHYELSERPMMLLLAQDLQSPLLHDPSVPAWVRVLPVELYLAAGDSAAASAALDAVSDADLKQVEQDRRVMAEKIREYRDRLQKTAPAGGAGK